MGSRRRWPSRAHCFAFESALHFEGPPVQSRSGMGSCLRSPSIGYFGQQGDDAHDPADGGELGVLGLKIGLEKGDVGFRPGARRPFSGQFIRPEHAAGPCAPARLSASVAGEGRAAG